MKKRAAGKRSPNPALPAGCGSDATQRRRRRAGGASAGGGPGLGTSALHEFQEDIRDPGTGLSPKTDRSKEAHPKGAHVPDTESKTQ